MTAAGAKKIKRAFIALTVVSFTVIGLLAWQIWTTHNLASDTKNNSATIGQLKVSQDDSCTNYEILRDAVNKTHGTLRGLLQSAIETNLKRAKSIGNAKLRAADLAAAKSEQRLKDNIEIVNARCAQKTPSGKLPTNKEKSDNG